MKLGIVGLPNAGKSTLFNALTKAGAQVANYPFCTIEPNVGVVSVPDERLGILDKMYRPKKVVPTSINFVDIAGLVKGASQGQGLGNKFLGHIREVDGIVHVVRCFADDNIIHVEGSVDPLRDIATINVELSLSDLETLQKKHDGLEKLANKTNDPKAQAELSLVKRLIRSLSETQAIPAGPFDSAQGMPFSEDEDKWLRAYQLLRAKPVLYAANVDEATAAAPSSNPWVKQVQALAAREGAQVIIVCAKIEAELSELPPEEVGDFWNTLGISENGLQQLVRTSFALLNLSTFLTVGEDEVRAWTITKDTKARQAAGKIHSDIERGFIAAEIVAYADLIKAGSMTAAKEKGWVRLEGEEYPMKDGDITNFRFNV